MTRETRTVDGYERLALAVLARAVRDASSKDVYIRRQARKWLSSPDGIDWCVMLDYSPDRLLAWLHNPRRLDKRGKRRKPDTHFTCITAFIADVINKICFDCPTWAEGV